MTSEQRKQPKRKSASEPGPAPMKSKRNAQLPIIAISAKTVSPRATPTSHEPTAMWRMPMGVRNWCFIDFDQMSKSTA